jgi:hypothetical protein
VRQGEARLVFLAYLEVHVEFTDDLGPVWAINSDCIDWENGTFEGPFRGLL